MRLLAFTVDLQTGKRFFGLKFVIAGISEPGSEEGRWTGDRVTASGGR